MADSPASDLLSADHGPAGDLPGFADRVRATVLGAALADALATADPGAGSAATAEQAPAGVDAETPDLPLRISADTQLGLYTMDGLLESIEWASAGEGADETACQWLAQLRWLRTQDVEWPQQAPSPLPRWIDAHEVLHADRGAQGQTLEGLRTGMMGEVERPVLAHADDRTVVVRSVPYGLLPVGWRSMAPLTIDAAAITHGDAEAQTASTALALTVQAAVVAGSRSQDRPVRAAVEAALSVLGQLTRPAQRTSTLLREALHGKAPEAAGAAPETLAQGVRAALAAEAEAGSAERMWAAAVGSAADGQGGRAQAGRQPSGAPLAGAIIAAAHGTSALPPAQLARLDAREVIEEAARLWIEGLGITG